MPVATSQRTWTKRSGYVLLRALSRLVAVLLFRVRCRGRDRIPRQGPLLVCSNHQSHFDPVLVGIAFNRRLNYLARQSLFHFTPLRWLIEFLDAIPIDREGLGLQGIKESLRRLRRGESLLVFPEGTRSRDGDIAPLQPGFCVLARRSGAALLPVAVDGAFDVLPRGAWWPRLGSIHVCIGEPIGPQEVSRLDDGQLVAELHRRLLACHRQARAGRQAGQRQSGDLETNSGQPRA